MEQFERVKVFSKDKNLAEIYSREGVVIGFSETSEFTWCAVYLDGETWMVQDSDLVSLGEKVDPDVIYPPPDDK